MSPKLYIHIGRRKTSSFHFFGVIGFIAGTLLGSILCYLSELEYPVILLMSLTGAATFFLLTILIKLITGRESIVYYHHEIAILISCSLVLMAIGRPVLPYIDITLLGIGLFLAFGRIGCHSVGCCHGRPAHHGIKYGEHHVKAGFTWYFKDVPLMPVQLIESMYAFAIVGIGIVMLLNNVVPGTVLLCYTVMYGAMRFILEFFRGDANRPYWYGLSEAQWTTIVLTGVTLAMGAWGWLPFYNWHLIIFIVLCITAMAVVFYYRWNERYIFFNPKHVKQLAEGINRSEAFDAVTAAYGEGFINTINTNGGLRVSYGTHKDGNVSIDHYTVSSGNMQRMRYGSVKRIAKLIGRLRNHSGKMDLIDNQNGIFHILFSR